MKNFWQLNFWCLEISKKKNNVFHNSDMGKIGADLTKDEKHPFLVFLLQQMENGVLLWGALMEAALHFNCMASNISQQWKFWMEAHGEDPKSTWSLETRIETMEPCPLYGTCKAAMILHGIPI